MICCALLLFLLCPLHEAFVIPNAAVYPSVLSTTLPISETQAFFHHAQLMAAATVDPTSVLTEVLGGILTSPAILAVPILAALAVAFLIGFLIFAYATPQVEDDE